MGPGDGAEGCFPSISKSSHDASPKSSEPKKRVPTNKSSPLDTSPMTISKKDSPQKTNINNPSSSVSSRLEQKKSSNWKIEIALPLSTESLPEHNSRRNHSVVLRSGWNENENSRPGMKCALFGKIEDEKVRNFGALKSGSRVVPLPDPEKLDPNPGALTREASDEDFDDEKEMQDLSMVRKQLAQIENQQSSLFELLQVSYLPKGLQPTVLRVRVILLEQFSSCNFYGRRGF